MEYYQYLRSLNPSELDFFKKKSWIAKTRRCVWTHPASERWLSHKLVALCNLCVGRGSMRVQMLVGVVFSFRFAAIVEWSGVVLWSGVVRPHWCPNPTDWCLRVAVVFELSWCGMARVDTLTQSTGVVSSLFGQSGFFFLFNIIGSSLA